MNTAEGSKEPEQTDHNNGFNFVNILQSLVALLFTIILGFIAWQSTKWTTQIETLSGNVGQLNTKMEVVVNNLNNYSQEFLDVKNKQSDADKLLNNHETRIRLLERSE